MVKSYYVNSTVGVKEVAHVLGFVTDGLPLFFAVLFWWQIKTKYQHAQDK